jgi:hypothetical protein
MEEYGPPPDHEERTAPEIPPDRVDVGLRCHDAHHGLTNVDPRSAYIARLGDVREVGMAANLAVNIRGQDRIEDADALLEVAAEELGVEPLLFGTTLRLLEEADMIDVTHVGSRRRIDVRIPVHEDLYDRLGEVWEARKPSELQQELVSVMHGLAAAPRLLDDLRKALPTADLETILKVGDATELIKQLPLEGGSTMLYSPYFAFENPDRLQQILSSHPAQEVQAAMARLRMKQGLLLPDEDSVLGDMAGRGLIMAPTVRSAGGAATFGFLPYQVESRLLRVEKAVLEKAVQILACIRYGQERAVATRITHPAAILRRLLDPSRNYTLKAHSEHKRQYYTLFRLQIVDFIPNRDWVEVKLIDTDDNKRAVRLAIDLLTYGEEMQERGLSEHAAQLLSHGDRYEHSLSTIQQRRETLHLPAESWSQLSAAMRGDLPL